MKPQEFFFFFFQFYKMVDEQAEDTGHCKQELHWISGEHDFGENKVTVTFPT
jgi:hypothetical protein